MGLRSNLREAVLVEEKVAEDIEGSPVAAAEGGGVGAGGHGLLERRSDGSQRVRQAVVR